MEFIRRYFYHIFVYSPRSFAAGVAIGVDLEAVVVGVLQRGAGRRARVLVCGAGDGGGAGTAVQAQE